MDIIVSHNNLDFDGLASMVAAGKLFPRAIPVVSGTLSKNVRKFMGLYKDSLVFKLPNEIDLEKVERVIVVDTRNLNRLGALKVLGEREPEYIVFDHHPSGSGDLVGIINEIHKVGATTTILVEKIREKGINLTPFEATILALGIYEDTGSLLFSSTTSRDAEAVAYLLSQGTNLSVVAGFAEEPFDNEQRKLLQALLENIKLWRINGHDVVWASSLISGFVPGLDMVTHHLSEVEACDAVFVAVIMQGKAQVVARSKTPNIMVNEILAPLDGRGHEKAASAVVKKPDLDSIEQIIYRGLEEYVRAGLQARDIMSSPVKSITLQVTMEEVGRTMLRYGHTGMPVVDGEELVGIISRRDVDKARTHNLGHAPVKGFMSGEVVTVTPDTPISEIRRIVVARDIGRVPVVDNGRLVGIVSRTDLLRTLHGDHYPEDHMVLFNPSDDASGPDLQDTMEARLPRRIKDILQIAGNIADLMEVGVYCVGGFVRDLLIGVPNFDVDLVVEGDGLVFAERLASKLGGRSRLHERFKTGVVLLSDGYKIDVATARTEYYEFPAALPSVERSSMREDLYRRDFTINTLAICLNQHRYGELVDYFGGLQDLHEGLIRILYNLSFVEDPTRIIRAIRFETRFKFRIEPNTLDLARDAIHRRLLRQLSHKRIRQELLLILEERDPMPALRRMDEIGVWEYVLPEVKLDGALRYTLRRVPRVLAWLAERQLDLGLRRWVVYLEVLLAEVSLDVLAQILDRYKFDRDANKSLLNTPVMIEMARVFQENPDMPMSKLDCLLRGYSRENIVFFLLCVNEEWAWEKAVKYMELVKEVKSEMTGKDLIEMGLKPGPVFQVILDKLWAARLDGQVSCYEEEMALVQNWLEEGLL
ncbi:MAG: CBS domain-containing protein [Syntrophomonadaceae bacterium]|nr:CBS domain-containing protein [Syntrophomonadaceae bacterium]